MRHAMPMQIINDHDSTGNAPHLRQHADTIEIRKMVEEQRADHRIEGSVAERELKRISCHGDALLGKLESAGIQVQRNDAAVRPLHQSFTDVASSRCHVQNGAHIGWQKTFDGVDSAEMPIDCPQFFISGRKLIVWTRRIIHELRFS